MSKLTKEEALNIREDDVVLVAMKVQRTNGHHDTRIGVKVTCFSPAPDHRPMAEREKGPQLIDIMSGLSIHSVAVRKVRVKDWVEFASGAPGGEQGKVLFIDGDEATIRLRAPGANRNCVRKVSELSRIPYPEDLSEVEKKALADAR